MGPSYVLLPVWQVYAAGVTSGVIAYFACWELARVLARAVTPRARVAWHEARRRRRMRPRRRDRRGRWS